MAPRETRAWAAGGSLAQRMDNAVIESLDVVLLLLILPKWLREEFGRISATGARAENSPG